jgi:predicted Zn-dependent protease
MRNNILLILLLAGSSVGTVTGFGQSRLFGLSPERDLEQGADVAKLVQEQIGLYSNPVTDAYLREIGERLVTTVNDSRWKFSFQIVNESEPNAFAIPGGGIYISRGLLALLNREDELAGILGHEMAHVTLRHSARTQRKGILTGVLSVPGNVVGSVVGENLGALINAPVDTVGGAWLSRYSRGQETESDRVGIQTAAQAGYDPTALADVLLRINEEVKSKTGQERQFSFFDSHPMTETRLKDIRSRAPAVSGSAKPRIAPDPASLFAKLDGIWWGENPETGVFRKSQFLHPEAGFTITFPDGWKHKNTPRFVLSSDPKGEAVLMLGITPGAADPEQTGEAFVRQMRSKARVEPVSTRRASIGEFPAYFVTYLDRSGRASAYLHFGWVTMAGKAYQLIGLAPVAHRETLRNAVLTLRPLTDVERRGVTGKRLRIVAARSGERLEELGARSGNVWSPAYTALINGLDPEKALDQDRLVKIAHEESSRP